jgi:transcriptional regulator with XRE-family HTH domain
MVQLRGVQEFAEQKGLNISSLSRQADITLSAARRYWYGTSEGAPGGKPLRDISLDVLEKIARVLGISLLSFFQEGD